METSQITEHSHSTRYAALSLAREFRLAYLAGPGDVWSLARSLAAGRKDERTTHVAYSQLLLQAARAAGVSSVLLLTTHPGGNELCFRFGGMEVEVRRVPDLLSGKRGLAFHAASFRMASALRPILLAFRPQVLLVADDPPRAAALELMRPPDCQIVRTQHCALTPLRRRRRGLHRLLLWLDGALMRSRIAVVLSASAQVSEQVRAVFGPKLPICEFLPHYERRLHAVSTCPPSDPSQLRVIFVGRIERDKGVFDLLEAARLLRERGVDTVSFDICGVGSALPELERALVEAGLEDSFHLQGFCDRARLQTLLAHAHVGVVPTRSEFVEGFNQACVEVLLSGRPVITSNAIPAVDYVHGAVLQVRCDDPVAYAEALAKLAVDRAGLAALQARCKPATEKFLRLDTSYMAALVHVLLQLRAHRPVSNRLIAFSGQVASSVDISSLEASSPARASGELALATSG